MLVVIPFYTQDFGDAPGGKLYMHNTALKNDADEDVISLIKVIRILSNM